VHTDAAPRARISLNAVVANVRAAAGSGDVVDLRRDARGHGFAEVSAALLAQTDAKVLADAADLARAGGVPDRIRASGDADVDPATAFGLRPGTTPALSLVGTVLGTKRLHAGEGVSYGYTFRAFADTRVALVTGGYGQGIPRSLGNRVRVAIGTVQHPVVGRVAMDVCVVDIGTAEVARGDAVVFFGDPATGAPSLNEWSRESNLSPLEIVAGVGLHTRREYVR
jgi:alanine racemase